jgi:uncharacterized protein YegP (UPF0339 family)
MATATKKSRVSRQIARRVGVVSGSAAITFLVFEDNGGSYCWTLLGTDGESLAQSRPYATHEEAAHAARAVRDGAGSARFEAGAAIDLVARRRAAAAREDSDAERWWDEGGSFSSQRVTR